MTKMIVTIIIIIITKQSSNQTIYLPVSGFFRPTFPLLAIFGFETMYFIDYLFNSYGN